MNCNTHGTLNNFGYLSVPKIVESHLETGTSKFLTSYLVQDESYRDKNKRIAMPTERSTTSVI